MLTAAPRGTKDILPATVGSWRYVEETMRTVSDIYGYGEIRTPIFEHTELFLRGIGDTTDVVEKEMYTFTDRGERSITLRPENTASVVRAYVENKLYAEGMPTKLFYIGPMFRYDRPQAGRMRQFHQFGVEAIGAASAIIDAEVIVLAADILNKLGLKDLKLLINSVGCPKCRPEHRQKLRNYFHPYLEELCEDCRSRYDRNPLRILDCKQPACKQIAATAPTLDTCLCEECSIHFSELQSLLMAAKLKFELDANLVRGLDYYTKTAFEIQYTPLGAQSALCGGGRYDGLVEQIGGPATPGIGFAMGIERVLLALEKQGSLPSSQNFVDVFIVSTEAKHRDLAFNMLKQFRNLGLKTEIDFIGRSLKAQMKQANRLNARHAIILGDEEVARGTVVLRDMRTSEQNEVNIDGISKLLCKTEVRENE